jgi:hypothetical protein
MREGQRTDVLGYRLVALNEGATQAERQFHVGERHLFAWEKNKRKSCGSD